MHIMLNVKYLPENCTQKRLSHNIPDCKIMQMLPAPYLQIKLPYLFTV